ncbi:proline-rich family protein [Zea mays]|uniref:Proline-rich family protein n=1 Tax=Zea mays TaxID=4577 RepID=A0A1D6PFC6_MAIZE|nr:proline-rich family protein [Zea mays]
MSSPPRGQPATAAVPAVAAATSPQLPAASHTLPRAFLATSSPRGVPIGSQPKVNPVPPVGPSNEQSNPKDREKSREEPTVVVINDRKVNLLDSESGSFYALCRSWVRNGVPHESQPSFGNGEPLLPRPLPASVVDSRISDKDDNDVAGEDSDEEPQKNANGEYNTSDLLKQHVKRAKRIRAGLQKDRLRRIERYKQRLALLL